MLWKEPAETQVLYAVYNLKGVRNTLSGTPFTSAVEVVVDNLKAGHLEYWIVAYHT